MKQLVFVMQKSFLLLLGFFAIQFFGCKPSTNSFPSFHPDFVNHISAYTSGIVDRSTNIVIVLTEPIKNLEKVKKNAPELFRFYPEIKGTWNFQNDRTLVFTPDQVLARSTIYQGVLDLSKLKKVDKPIKRFPFRFETKQQRISLTPGGLQLYPDNNPRLMYLTGDVQLNDKEKLEDVEACLFAFHNQSQKKIKWVKLNDNHFFFRIDSLKRSEADGSLKLRLNGASISSKEIETIPIVIPGLGEFRIISTEVQNEPDQKIFIHFSDAISETQNLVGLIKLDDKSDVNFEYNGNKLTIFPSERLKGVHKVNCSNSIQNTTGYALKGQSEYAIGFEEPKPKLRMVGTGTIVPDAKGVVFPFESMALKAVDIWVFKIYEKNIAQFLQTNDLDEAGQLHRVGELIHEGKVDLSQNKKVNNDEWTRYTLNLSNYIKQEPGAIYRVMIGFRKSYTYFNCPDEEEDHGTESNSMYYEYYSNDNSYLRDYSPCDNSFYYYGAITRNILASDLGIIVKAGSDGLSHVFTSNLTTATPISRVKLDFYNFQNRLLSTVYSDSNGMATCKLKDEAYLLVASQGNQKGYIKLGNGRNKSTSKFDVDGITVQNGLEGLIYGERGVWRPGDSMYVCFVLNDDLNKLPKNVPVSFKLKDPQGKLVSQKVRTTSVNRVYDFRCATNQDAPTGNYRAEVSVGDVSFYKTLSVETVQPNRLKIKWNVQDSTIDLNKKSPMHLSASWLHGAIAPGLAYSVQARIRSINTNFKGYEKFHFDDDSKDFNGQERIIANGKLNAQGEIDINPDFNVNQQVSGKLKVDLLTKVFEKSGNFSVDYSSYDMSPYSRYVGILAPDAEENNTLVTDKSHVFHLAHLEANGKKVANANLHVKVYRINWRWWWESNRNLSSYMQSNSLIPIMDSVVSSRNGAGQVSFKISYPNWGRFLIVAKDPVSGHSASTTFYVDWPYWRRANRNNNDEAATLRLSTDKTQYTPGNKVKVTVPSSGKGKALVCIENGTSILKKFWINTDKSETSFSFSSTKEMAPNAYVHVTYLQPYNQTDNDLPVRLYGIVPIKVVDPNTKLEPSIAVADEIRPDRKEKIVVSEATGKAMTYTLAVVDDGLLDLTHFRTPNLWSHFYRKRGLGVRTWDLYDDVMGGYAGKWGNVLSVGGDEEGSAAGESGHRANRFVPAVRFLGPYYLAAGKKAVHHVELGDYIGSVRVMVVARQGSAFGQAEKTVKVKKPIMVLTTMPRVLTPGEEISIPVTVFNLEKKSKKVKVEIKVEGCLDIKSEQSKTIEFAADGDEMVVFNAIVKEQIGLAKVKVRVSDGTEVSTSETELEVRAPNVMASEVEEYMLKPGESKNIKVVFNGLDGTNSGKIEVSGLPPVNLWQRLSSLIQYPHGCVEQTTSSVFAQLYLEDFSTLDNNQKAQVTNNLNAALRRLQSFQTSNGGLSYWPGSSNTNEWGTNYAGHFITAAKNKGYFVSEHFYSNWLNFQTNASREYEPGNISGQLIQAYRLYTLALAGHPEIASMNRLRETKNISANAQWRLAAAYILAGMPETATLITSRLSEEVGPYKQFDITFGSQLRDKALLLETLVLMKNESKGLTLLKEVSKELSSNQWLSTQETAYSLIALAGYHHLYKSKESMEMSFTQNGRENIVRSEKPFVQMELAQNAKKSTVQTVLKNRGKSTVFVRLIKQGVPVQTDTTKWQKNIQMSVEYFNFDGKPLNVKRLIQGEEFKIKVIIQNPGQKGRLSQMALSHLIPGGWEISNLRMHGENSGNSFTYQDVRDDRVYTYFDLGVNQKIEINLIATATYAGRFYMPAVGTECMYDNAIAARIPGGWVEVVTADTKSTQ